MSSYDIKNDDSGAAVTSQQHNDPKNTEKISKVCLFFFTTSKLTDSLRGTNIITRAILK